MMEGYGIRTDTMRLKGNAYRNLLRMILDCKSSIGKQAVAFYKRNSRRYKSLSDSFYDYCEETYRNKDFGWTGIEGVITDFINEQEFGGAPVFQNDEYAIYVMSFIPRDEKEKAKMPTREQIRKILTTYFSPLLKEPQGVGWIRVAA